MQLSFRRCDALVAMVIAAIATLSGAKIFKSWDQVNLLWESGADPFEMIGNTHLPRYLVSYPGFLLEDAWPGIGFSLYICLFFSLNVVLLRLIALVYRGRPPSLLAYFVFVFIQLAMNGRGVIAWSGWLVCMLICLRVSAGYSLPAFYRVGLMAVSAFLSSVTSGVYITVMFAFAIVLPWRLPSRSNLLGSSILFVLAVPLFSSLLNHLHESINKNLLFYGGGWSGLLTMASHGFGGFFEGGFTIFLLSAAAVSVSFLAILVRASYGVKFTTLERLIGIASIGGLFGFTVFTLSIPPLLLQFFVAPSNSGFLLRRHSSK